MSLTLITMNSITNRRFIIKLQYTVHQVVIRKTLQIVLTFVIHLDKYTYISRSVILCGGLTDPLHHQHQKELQGLFNLLLKYIVILHTHTSM